MPIGRDDLDALGISDRVGGSDCLHALRDLPGLGLKDREAKSLGRFRPSQLGVLHTLMTRGASNFAIRLYPDGADWPAGRWEEFGLWTSTSFLNRVERRVTFDGVS